MKQSFHRGGSTAPGEFGTRKIGDRERKEQRIHLNLKSCLEGSDVIRLEHRVSPRARRR